MQRRPLHMVMVSGVLPSVYAHAMEASTNSRITITSYPLPGGRQVWYLGGNLAEQGVARSAQEQMDVARSELEALLPWLNLSTGQWATLRIDRAEVATPDGRRPNDAFLAQQDRVLVTRPTKLAFAPRVADLVLEALHDVEPAGAAAADLPLAMPPLAQLPWENVEWS